MKTDAFKKAFKQRITGMLQSEFEAKLDEFVDKATDVDIMDMDDPEHAVSFKMEHTFQPEVLKFIQQMLG